MKESRFSDSQKAFIIKQGNERTPVAEICRRAGIARRPILKVTAKKLTITAR